MDRRLIEKTESFLKERYSAGIYLKGHPEEMTYRLEHSYRVANIGRRIAQEEGFDETEMVIACLLHDVSYCEEFGEEGWREHGRRSAAIAIHVDDEADFEGERTPFALSVGDADNIDRFDAYRIHEALSRDGFLEMPFEEKREHVRKRLCRLRELAGLPMGTKTAEKLWRERLSFYASFYEKLADQLACSFSVGGGD